MEDDAGRRKVGHSDNPMRRSFELGSTPLSLLYATKFSPNAYRVERTAHRILRVAGKHIKGEWFTASLDECVAAIERAERIVAGLEPDVKADAVLVGVRFTFEKLNEIEAWRRRQPKMPSRGDAIRHLVRQGLASVRAKAA